MLVFLITEAVEVLLALGRVSYNGVIGLYKWYFNISPEEQKTIEMKSLEERVIELERLLNEKES